MSKPTKISEKNTTPKRRSVRVTVSAYKRPSAEESSKKPAPEIERMVSDEGLKRKQWEIEVFHNIVMRLTDHLGIGDALWFEVGENLCRFSINELCLITSMKCVGSTHLPPVVKNRLITRYFLTLRGVSRENLELQMSNANFDNDDDAVKLNLLYMIFSIPLSNANSIKIDPKFFALADNLDDFNDFPWGVLSWEATRAAICNTVENMMSSKRRPLKKSDKVHYSIVVFPHALLVWACETLPSIATKFTTKYDHAIPRILSWITTDNLYLKNPKVVPQLPPKTSVPRLSSDTNSEWWEFQKEIRGQGQGKAHTVYHVSSRQKINVPTDESDALKTTSNDLGSGSQDDVFINSDIGAVADMGVQTAMEFLTADKVIVSHKDVEQENNKEESILDPEKEKEEEKDDKESIREQEVIKLEDEANEESIGDVIVTNICN
ncbi:hypothetical protein TIFTF001_039539 [Ficus carica]|uniref:DUF1985 domain-containing protein n=1 Tax=Ficus carica TaxID=3494 RepID=A0AA88ECH9_FICCA|nr:hypothetical protein TIFTF001_039537 [Ficus carica]GMN70497.1 hypothetical protein TIFTF001_039539 [Ficus carica]